MSIDYKFSLHLSLCGMLPYKPLVKLEFGEYSEIPYYYSEEEFLPLDGMMLDWYGDGKDIKSITPLLHSLDKLDTLVVEDGKTAMEWIEIYTKHGKAYLIEQIINGLVETLVFEQLKKWHFNIYNLPKGMYLEKSENNIPKP